MRKKLTYRQLYNQAVQLKYQGIKKINVDSPDLWLASQTAHQLTGDYHWMATFYRFSDKSLFKEVPQGYAKFCENTCEKEGKDVPIDTLIEFCKKQITSRGGKV